MTDDDLIDVILSHEGGYVNDAVDRGGPTNFGVTAATLGQWRQLGRDATDKEVQALTIDEARQIYRAQYIEWPGLTAANIPHHGLRAALVDEGVNSGPRVAIQHLQEALGVAVDGIIGPVTREALRCYPNPSKLVIRVVRLRCLRYARIVQHNPSQRRFLVGWLTRAFTFIERL